MRMLVARRSDPRWLDQSRPSAILLDPRVSIPRRAVAGLLVESVFIVAAIGLSARLATLVAPAALASDSWWMLPLAALLGVLCADLASGVLHWFCDTFFSERTPIIGPAFILPFREHHADPRGILRHGLVELHGNSSLAVALVLGVLWALPWDLSGQVGDFARAWLFCMAVATLATNQVHRWAHSEVPPAPARWLQRGGLILSPEGHARHHCGGFHRSFCITTGWLNPLLDRIDFFPRLERRFRSRARSG
jgi:ubiquitin-conjugating enzyme E2 variant